MIRENREANEWTLGLLKVQPTDHVLEVGFGPGVAIQSLARIVTVGRIAGIDSSETMVRMAARRNAAAIAAGRVELKCGDAGVLPYETKQFNKVLAVNVIYFLPDPHTAVKEMHRVMKPGGDLAMFFVAKEVFARSTSLTDGIFTFRTPEEVAEVFQEADFGELHFRAHAFEWGTGICVLASK